MTNIFTDKELLNLEYRRLFLDKLSDLNKIKESIKGRYGKDISDNELKNFFEHEETLIYFVGSFNINRLNHFFGKYEKRDERDSLVRLIDRFLLDSINFEILNGLIVQLNEEYLDNQIDIDNAWSNELSASDYLGGIEPIYIIQKAITQNKINYFNTLNFQSQTSVHLFDLNNNQLISNKEVFSNWIPKPVSPLTFLNNVISKLPFELETSFMIMSIFGIIGLFIGASLGIISLSFGFLGIGLGVSIGMILGVVVDLSIDHCVNSKLMSMTETSNDRNQDLQCSNKSSHLLMNEKMPGCSGKSDGVLNNDPPRSRLQATRLLNDYQSDLNEETLIARYS